MRARQVYDLRDWVVSAKDFIFSGGTAIRTTQTRRYLATRASDAPAPIAWSSVRLYHSALICSKYSHLSTITQS